MPMVFWFFVVISVFAIGDIIGLKTKAFLSSTFIMLLVFLVLFLTKVIPADVIAKSGFKDISTLATYLVFTDMGTMIDTGQLKAQWKVTLMAVFSMLCSAIGILCVMPFIGKENALVSIPIINGALGATTVMVGAASEKGFAMAAALGTLIYGLQKFVGTPPASLCGRSIAKKLVEHYRENLKNGLDLLSDDPDPIGRNEKKQRTTKSLYERAGKYATAPVLLSVLALIAYGAHLVARITGFNYTVWCLLLGFLARYFGILPEKPLTKAASNGFFLIAVFGTIVPSLADVKFDDLGILGVHLIWIFGASMLSIFLLTCVLPTWKILGSRQLTFGVSVCQLLGFPATMIVTREIALGYGATEQERAYIERNLMVPYVVSGLVSVTILSVFVAGVLANFL